MAAAYICPRWRPDIVMITVSCWSGKRSGSPNRGQRGGWPIAERCVGRPGAGYRCRD